MIPGKGVVISQSLTTPIQIANRERYCGKNQSENKRQKSFPELFHLFSQIPCGSSHQSIDLNAGFTPKVIFRHPIIIYPTFYAIIFMINNEWVGC
jgi:hypothetical protein